MTERTGQQALEAFFAAFKAQDAAAMQALMAPDFVIYEADGLPYAGVYRGYAGWLDLLVRIGATWESMAPTISHLVGDGRHFAVRMDLTLTAKATGRTLDTSVFELWTVADGKIKEVRPYYWDTAAVAALVA